MLPKVTGLGVLHEIRKTSSVPVLMLTAIGDEYTQVTSFDEQADDYMTKPFSMVLLGRRITALLRRSGKGITLDTMTFHLATWPERGGRAMLEIAICEDEQADRERLRGMLSAILDKYNMGHRITCYSSGEELLGFGVRFQLIFMDIVMEGRNGIDIGSHGSH